MVSSLPTSKLKTITAEQLRVLTREVDEEEAASVASSGAGVLAYFGSLDSSEEAKEAKGAFVRRRAPCLALVTDRSLRNVDALHCLEHGAI